MKKKALFKGVGTAIITPFKNDEIDYGCLGALIDRQIEAGVQAIIACGTTGEAATLTDKERYRLFEWIREYVDQRVTLILGTGSPDTRRAIEYTRIAEKVGADGALVVTPYYNKGTKEGLYQHFLAITEATNIPIILYNVPSRTGVSLSQDTLERLAALPQIAGIKEASDSAQRLSELSTLSNELPLYSGADALIYSALSLGGAGVISVVSNLYPKETVEICKQFFAESEEKSRELQHKMRHIINALFLDTNPAPIKYAMSRRGLCSSEMRLPMWLPTERCQRQIDLAMDSFEQSSNDV